MTDKFNKKGSFDDDIMCEPLSERNNEMKIEEILEMVNLKTNEYNTFINSNADDDESNDT